MTPPSSPGATASGSFVTSAAAYGVSVARPTLLLWVLGLVALCIVALTAIDLAFLSAQVAYMGSLAGTKSVLASTLRSTQLTSALFVSAVMSGVLALIAFGHNWARWVWLVVCMLIGFFLAVGTVVLMFMYAAPAAMLKCALYAALLVLSCMLFAPSCNAWFRQIKEIRNNPRLNPGVRTATPADADAGTAQPYQPYAPPGAAHAAPAAPLAIPPRPRTVTVALALCLANGLAGLVLGLIYMSDILATQNIVLGEGAMKYTVYGSVALGVVMTLVLIYFMSRGSNVARWIWTIMAVLGFLNAYTAVKMAFVISPLYGTLATISQLVALAATVLLFVPASNRWIREVTLARRS